MAAKAGVARMERLGFGAVEPAAGAAVLGALLRSLGGLRAPAQLTGSVFFWDRCETHAAGSSQSYSAAGGSMRVRVSNSFGSGMTRLGRLVSSSEPPGL